MKYTVRVSVILPCFNSEQFIAQAIESILAQSFPLFELIIVDDGSTDNSLNIIEYFSDARIVVIKNLENVGNYPSRNIAARIAKGKYICVMDADDISLPDRLAMQYAYMEANPGVGLVGCRAELINRGGNIIGTTSRIFDFPRLKIALLGENQFTHSSICLRTNLIHKYGLFYDETLKYASDFDLVVRFAGLSRITNLHEVLIRYRVHGDQISARYGNDQVRFANLVKCKQLGGFGVAISREEKELYLKLLGNQAMLPGEMEECVNLLNVLFEANSKLRMYKQAYLFDFFQMLLQKKFAKNGP